MIVAYCKELRFNFFYFVISQPHGHYYAPTWPVCLFFPFSVNWEMIVLVKLISLTNSMQTRSPVRLALSSLLEDAGARAGHSVSTLSLFLNFFLALIFFRQNEITNFNKKFQEESLPSPADILNDWPRQHSICVGNLVTTTFVNVL
jgi:hypothetical protein